MVNVTGPLAHHHTLETHLKFGSWSSVADGAIFLVDITVDESHFSRNEPHVVAW